MTATLAARSLSVSRADRWILRDVDLVVAPGRRIGLVGPNGVGKSTLLATLSGAIAPDAGSVTRSPAEALVGWLVQEPERRPLESVRAMLHRRTGADAAQVELDAATAALAAADPAGADRYAAALDRWLSVGAADLDARIESAWADLGLGPELLERPTSVLSGGEAARASLAVLLLSRFDVYLLDEPTNDLDLDGLDRLERWVDGLAAGLVVVSHDRRFLERIVTHVVEIDEFEHAATEYAGGWEAYLAERDLARQHAWQRFETYDTKRRGLAQRAQREREWASQGLARVKRTDEPDKNIRAFKLNQTEQLAGRAAQTERAMERLERVDKPRTPWELRFDIAGAEPSGEVVVRCVGLVVDRGEFRLGPIDLLVERGERVALVGANGSGKSTLIDVVLGRVEPSSGSVALGPSVVVGEIEQARGRFLGDASLVRAFQDATGWTVADARTLLAKFGLVGAHVERPAATLSPGERTRAAMALLMASGTNLLVLDEPTNHLDLPAIEQLEQAVDAFAGTVLLVTHDRTFLERFRATRRIELVAGQVVTPPR